MIKPTPKKIGVKLFKIELTKNSNILVIAFTKLIKEIAWLVNQLSKDCDDNNV
jgi:hypothetical protein